MESMFLIATTIVSSVITATSTAVGIAGRDMARREAHKRQLIEQRYKMSKSAYIAKQRALQMTIESKNNKIEALQSKVSELTIECARLEEVYALENKATQSIIEARDCKIETQNAKIVMLQTDYSKLQKELKAIKEQGR